jgi:glycosyltransferase involved in cell wall biosynthesis
MTNPPLVSVIIPVYNAEAYIDKCLCSINAQTLHDYEVILVNDGSTDRSGEICEKYAQKDSRIKVFHKSNSGVSKTRQYGLDHSMGEYVIHVDPDDWVDPCMLADLYSYAIHEEADMVICDFYMNGKEEIYIKQKPKSLDTVDLLNGLFTGLHGSCCNKLVRRSCFTKYGITFPKDFNLYEDLYINTSLLCNNIKVSYLNKAYYHYMIFASVTSVTKRIDKKSIDENDSFVKAMMLLLANKNETKELFLKSLSYSIVLKGYKSKLYSSKEFINAFKPYRKYILSSSNGNFFAKCVCYLSCYGFYGLLKHLY